MAVKLEIKVSGSELRFRGNTFLFKEQIKSLGKARWNSSNKEWIVKGVSLSEENIRKNFPEALILNSEDNSIKNPLTFEEETLPSGGDSSNSSANNFPGALSVSELSSLISIAISRQFPGDAKVFGRISSLKILDSGRVYFDLVDIEAGETILPCVIWENDAKKIVSVIAEAGFNLENDLPVLVSVQARFNSRKAQISLMVKAFIPEYTLGKLLAEREKTNKKLILEGIYNKNRESHFPKLPQNIAIITSKGGTVINDFMASLEVSEFGFNLFWRPVRVQGSSAADEIIKSIEYFDKREEIDVILVFRGGGSASELALFNSYEIAKTVCMCSKPVLSAIGHEYDQSSVQDVSYKYFGVPKDLGRFLSDIIVNLRTNLRDNAATILNQGEKSFVERKNSAFQLGNIVVNQGSSNLVKFIHSLKVNLKDISNSMYSILALAQAQLKNFNNLNSNSLRTLNEYERNIISHASLLKAVSPEVQLKRGFSLIKDTESGKYLTSSNDISEEKSFNVLMKDGEITARKVLEK